MLSLSVLKTFPRTVLAASGSFLLLGVILGELGGPGGVLLGAPGDVLTQDSKTEEGFVPLFNGKDLTGWQYTESDQFDGKISSSDGRYTAREGMLVVNPQADGPHLRQLWTTQQFPKNFTLKLEFRASVDADSGIFIRKPQLQCRDYLVAGPYKELKHYKAQDWNEIIIVVKDNVAHCTCNGEVLQDALVLPETGPIGLEADRGELDYRNIRIKSE